MDKSFYLIYIFQMITCLTKTRERIHNNKNIQIYDRLQTVW